MFIEINLNNHIHVRLDKKGEQILKQHYNIEDISDFKSPKVGYYTFQMWQFIEIFSNQICGSYTPYSMLAYIDSKDLSLNDEVDIGVELKNYTDAKEYIKKNYLKEFGKELKDREDD